MSSIKVYKFSDLYKMSSGISTKPKQAGHGAPFLSFSAVFKDYFLPDNLEDFMDTSEKEKEVYSIKKGDIFLTRTSETLDELGMSSVAVKDYTNASYSGFLKRLRPTQDDISYDKYMAFYLRSKLFRKTMTNNAIMTLRASLNEQIFSYLDLLLPSYSEQKKVGDFLYLLNEKIEINNKINIELEAMAKLIYDYWFVQFDFPDEDGKPYKSSGGKMAYNVELKREIPEGWDDGVFSDLGDIVAGGTPSTRNKDYFTKKGIAWISPKDLSINKNKYIDRGATDISKLGLANSSAKLMPKGAVLLTTRAPIGYIGISLNEVSTNQGFKSIVPFDKFGSEFVYYSVKFNVSFLQKIGVGSTFKEISKEVFSKVKVVIPDDEVLQLFISKITPIAQRIKIAETENQKLSELRDWLLPMLMNGQVTVGEAKEELGMVAEEGANYKS